MAIFMNHEISKDDDPGQLAPEHSQVALSLTRLGLSFTTRDQSVQLSMFWHKLEQAAADLQPQFEAEGNGFIAANLIREAEEDHLPEIRSGKMARYFYMVRP